MTLGQFLKTVEECCPQTAYAVKLRCAALASYSVFNYSDACSLVIAYSLVSHTLTTGARKS